MNAIVSTVIATPSRSGVCGIARSAERAAQHEEHHHADEPDEHRAEKRQRLGVDVGRGVHQIEQRRRGEPARGAEQDRESGRGEKRLVDDAVHFVGFVRAGEPRHQHAPCPVNTDVANTMTTMMICQLTPMAALPV